MSLSLVLWSFYLSNFGTTCICSTCLSYMYIRKHTWIYF